MYKRQVFVESDELKTVPVGLVSLQTALRTDYPVLDVYKRQY